MQPEQLETPQRGRGKAFIKAERIDYFLSDLGEQGDAYELVPPSSRLLSKLRSAAVLQNVRSSLGLDLLKLFGGNGVILKRGKKRIGDKQDALENAVLKLFDEIEAMDGRQKTNRAKYISSFADVGAFPIRIQHPSEVNEPYPTKPEPPHVDYGKNHAGSIEILLSLRGLALILRLWPHVLLMTLCNGAARVVCDRFDAQDISLPSDLHDAYALMGATISLLLVFRTNAAYDRFYEGKKLVGTISNQLRQIVLNAYSFLAVHEDPELAENLHRNYDINTPAQVQRLRERIKRWVGILYGMTRQKLRESRVGFLPHSTLGAVRYTSQTWFFDETRPRLIDQFTPREIVHFSRILASARHKKRGCKVKFKTSAHGDYMDGTIDRVNERKSEVGGQQYYDYDVRAATGPGRTVEIFPGVPVGWIHPVLSSKDTQESADSRVIIASQKVMDLTQRLCAHLFFGKSFAEAVTRNMQDLLDATSSCQRIVDTPLPFLYSHMLSLLLFVFVYSTPFMFSFPTDDGGGDERGECSRLGWLPSILLVLGYYGIEQIAVLIENPFNYEDIDHDLEAFGRRVEEESAAITLQTNNGSVNELSVASFWELQADGTTHAVRKQFTAGSKELKRLISTGQLDPSELAKIDQDEDGEIDAEEIESYLIATGRSPSSGKRAAGGAEAGIVPGGDFFSAMFGGGCSDVNASTA